MQPPFVTVFHARGAGPCRERALVLRSQGIVADVVRDDDGYTLIVSEFDAAAAIRELDLYREENASWPPRSKPVKYAYRNAWPAVVFFVLIMLAVDWIATVNLAGAGWYQAGKVDAALIRGGEWWRAFTALTLHIDIGHLASNLAFGGLFCFFAGRYFGSGFALLAVLMAGAAGNILNSFLMLPSHTAVGASTAIFAALGMIASFVWRRKLFSQEHWARRMGPVVVGIAMLAYFGTGGERTDVSAHVTGFICGFLSGIVMAAYIDRLPRGAAAQWVSGFATLAAVVLTWRLALI